MGFFRKSGVVLLCIILSALLLIGGILLTLSFSLSHKNVHDGFSGIIREVVSTDDDLQNIHENYNSLKTMCLNKPEIKIRTGNFSEIKLPCSEVAKGEGAVINFTTNHFIDDFYYKNYTCFSFGNCLDISSEENNGLPLYLFSGQFRDSLLSDFYFVFIFIILCLVLIFFLLEEKINLFYISGSLLVGVSFVLLVFKKIVFNLLGAMVSKSDVGISFADIFSVMKNSSGNTFWIYFVFGILLIAAGILLKIFVYVDKKIEEEDN